MTISLETDQKGDAAPLLTPLIEILQLALDEAGAVGIPESEAAPMMNS